MPAGFEKLGIVAGFEFIEVNAMLSDFRFAEQLLRHRLAAHSDAAVDFPTGDFDAVVTESGRPGRDVLIDRVDESAVEVEQDWRGRGFGRHGPYGLLVRGFWLPGLHGPARISNIKVNI